MTSVRAPSRRPEGEVTVEGYVGPATQPGWFSATDDPADAAVLHARSGGDRRGARPAARRAVRPGGDGPAPPERYPDPARHLPRPPNNHLSYAITWYGLAVALVVIFVLWARKG